MHFMNQIINDIIKVYEKYSKYEYIDCDVSSKEYHIKTKQEFDSLNGGICWDFVGPIKDSLIKYNIISYCFFTSIHKAVAMIASHVYIIVPCTMQWIECAWQSFKGIHEVKSFSDIENLLKNEYNADEVHTTIYDPSRTYGLSTNEFFKYLDEHGVALS